MTTTTTDPADRAAPWLLTDAEVRRLLEAFTEGKMCILEDDALTLVRWAQRQRAGALALAGVLAGRLTPRVEGARVTVEVREPLRPPAAPASRKASL